MSHLGSPRANRHSCTRTHTQCIYRNHRTDMPRARAREITPHLIYAEYVCIYRRFSQSSCNRARCIRNSPTVVRRSAAARQNNPKAVNTHTRARGTQQTGSAGSSSQNLGSFECLCTFMPAYCILRFMCAARASVCFYTAARVLSVLLWRAAVYIVVQTLASFECISLRYIRRFGESSAYCCSCYSFHQLLCRRVYCA